MSYIGRATIKKEARTRCTDLDSELISRNISFQEILALIKNILKTEYTCVQVFSTSWNGNNYRAKYGLSGARSRQTSKTS